MITYDKELFDDAFLKSLEHLTLLTRKALAAMASGDARSPRKGGMVEFADHRRYVLGDDPRYVDWNLYGRTGGLFVKEFNKEEGILVQVLLDTSASMDFGKPRKSRFGARLAAALSLIALTSDNRVRVHLFSNGLKRSSTEMHAGSDFSGVLAFLSGIKPEGRTSISGALQDLSKLSKNNKALIIIISDLMDENDPRQSLALGASNGMEIVIFHILCSDEIHPSIRGLLQLKDAEETRVTNIEISRRDIALYQDALRNFCDEWRAFCAKHEMHYFYVPTTTSIQDIVLKYLRTKGFVR